MTKTQDIKFQPGDVVIWTDDQEVTVQGYTSVKCHMVALKDETGLQFSAHESELRFP